jgi:hypothetical protein
MKKSSKLNIARLRWFGALIVIAALGIASRRFATMLPTLIAQYAGDTLYAAAMFALVAVIAPRWSVSRIAIVAFIACVLIELSQLYHAPWIDAIRAMRMGGWILGFGFLWTDLICYAVGVGMLAGSTAIARAQRAFQENS